MQKWFMHVDMDGFYASIEQRDHPELRGKPLIVGGKGPRGVVSAASYEIRPFGVHSAMPIAQAVQLCPHAIIVPVRMARYVEVSHVIMDILRGYSPRVEQASVDEAYLDATGLERLFGPIETMARRIKKDILDVTGGLTCSIGLAPVKF
ncbi:DNA polymerase IV, partial [uncultured Bilophila sp.]